MATMEEQQSTLQAARIRAFSDLMTADAAAAEFSLTQRQIEARAAHEQLRQNHEKAKRVADASLERGANFLLNFLAASLDIASAGITFVISLVLYLLTLGRLDLEMIYGTHFARGKSRLISPLSWDPIPMPIDKEALLLSGLVVAANIALVLALLILGTGGLCLLHDYAKITESPVGALGIGASLAQGQSGGLCLGGIIGSILGLAP